MLIKLYKTIFTILIFTQFSFSQPNDIMIVEYVDWNSGNGWGVKIFNPTSAQINLNQYVLRVFNNGGTSPTGALNLNGTILPGQTKIIGNQSYCGPDCGNCDFSMNNAGVNGNDCIALSIGLTTNWVDMINLYGVDVFPRIAGFTQALLQNKIVRNPNNCTRYTSTTGIGSNSWPSNSTANFTGWTVQGISCINQGFALAQVPQFSLPNDTSLCTGQSFTINTGLGPPNTFIWSTGETGPSITVLTSGIFRLILNPGGCESRDSIQVTFSDAVLLALGSDTATCYPDSLVLDAGSGYTSYLWNTGDTSQTLVPDTFGTYSVQVSLSGCFGIDSILIISPPTQSMDLGNDTILCSLIGFQLEAEPGFDFYLWNTMESAPVISPLGEGLYSVSAKKGRCNSYGEINIRLYPSREINLGEDIEKCPDEEVSITVPIGYVNYLWNTGGSLNTEKVIDSGWVSIAVTDINDCVFSDSIRIFHLDCDLFIPNVITPNNDGKNDFFYIKGLKNSAQLNIYNRWGREVFSTLSYENNWNGNNLADGSYFYLLKMNNKEYKGWIQILN